MSQKIAFCCVSTDNDYIYKCIVTLKSVQRFFSHKNFSFFILGNISNQTRISEIEKYGINFKKINFPDFVNTTRTRIWPSECLWKIKLLECFDDNEFDYLWVLDGDIICVQEFDLKFLDQIEYLAAPVIEQENSYYLQDEFDQSIYRDFSITRNMVTNEVCCSCTIIYNLKNLKKFDFNQKVEHSYQIFAKKSQVFNDETILNLLHFKYRFIYHLNQDWNYSKVFSFPNLSPSVNLIHFTGMRTKPWEYLFTLNNLLFKVNTKKYLYFKQWNDFAVDIFGLRKSISLFYRDRFELRRKVISYTHQLLVSLNLLRLTKKVVFYLEKNSK